MVVISDASPIRALHHLGLLSLCPDLYGRVIVPEAVRQELLRPTSVCPALEIADDPRFEVRTGRSNPGDLGVPDDLDAGEIEAIVIAMEIQADLLLMDGRKGTEVARKLGVPTIGVIGVLLEAKRKGLIDRVVPYVDRLVTGIRFHLTAKLRKRVAELAGE